MLIGLGLIPQPITQILVCGWIPLMWTGHLIISLGKIKGDVHSSSGQPWSKELLKGWTGGTEVEATNRAARVSAEGKLPEWVQRWLSYRNQWKGTQWCTCAAKIPTYPARMSSIYSEKWISLLFFHCTDFASVVGKKKPPLKIWFHKWRTWQRPWATNENDVFERPS